MGGHCYDILGRISSPIFCDKIVFCALISVGHAILVDECKGIENVLPFHFGDSHVIASSLFSWAKRSLRFASECAA